MDMIDYGLHFITLPYVWGGNTPEQGMDCSGFIQELLRSQYKYGGDRTSQGIYDYLKNQFLYVTEENEDLDTVMREDILFFGANKQSITHVAMAVDSWKLIEAAGEGRNPTDKGFVRVRPLNYRRDFVTSIRIYNK